MAANSNQNPLDLAPVRPDLFEADENRVWKKMKEGPILPLATTGFLGIAAYRIYQARQRGEMRLSFFLIHTRLAAQGFGVAALGSLVIYQLGQRAYKLFNKDENEATSSN